MIRNRIPTSPEVLSSRQLELTGDDAYSDNASSASKFPTNSKYLFLVK